MMRENKKILKFLGIFCLLGGLIFLICGTVMCFNIFDYSDTVETTAVITKIESYRKSHGKNVKTTHETYVKYEADGVVYEEKMGSYSSSWKEGQELEIYYHIDAPKDIGTKETDKVAIIMPIMGLVISSVGGVFLTIYYKRR